MAQAFTEAVGTVNGVNTSFTTSTNYVAGTLRVFRNGRLVKGGLDEGFTEGTPPAFTMKVAPLTGDVIFCYYTEA